MDDARRCTAKSKQSGVRCKRAAIVGGTVCSMHGGKAPAVAANAAARTLLQTYGLPHEVDPLDALMGELHRTAGHVAWLSQQVSQLTTVIATGAFGNQSTDALVRLYQSERMHLARVAADCLKAGVEERRVRLAEEQGRLVADVIRRIVEGLGLDPSAPEVRDIVRRELVAVA